MGKIVIELIQSGEKIVTNGVTAITNRVFNLVKVILSERLERYKDFSDNWYPNCKPVNIYDFQKKCCYKECFLISPDGKSFDGSFKDLYKKLY